MSAEEDSMADEKPVRVPKLDHDFVPLCRVPPGWVSNCCGHVIGELARTTDKQWELRVCGEVEDAHYGPAVEPAPEATPPLRGATSGSTGDGAFGQQSPTPGPRSCWAHSDCEQADRQAEFTFGRAGAKAVHGYGAALTRGNRFTTGAPTGSAPRRSCSEHHDCDVADAHATRFGGGGPVPHGGAGALSGGDAYRLRQENLRLQEQLEKHAAALRASELEQRSLKRDAREAEHATAQARADRAAAFRTSRLLEEKLTQKQADLGRVQALWEKSYGEAAAKLNKAEEEAASLRARLVEVQGMFERAYGSDKGSEEKRAIAAAHRALGEVGVVTHLFTTEGGPARELPLPERIEVFLSKARERVAAAEAQAERCCQESEKLSKLLHQALGREQAAERDLKLTVQRAQDAEADRTRLRDERDREKHVREHYETELSVLRMSLVAAAGKIR